MASPQIDFSKYAAPASAATSSGQIDFSKYEAAPAAEKKSWLDHAADAAKEYWDQVNPKTAVEGMRDLVNHPIDTGGKMLQAQGDVAKKAEAAFKAGNYAEGMRHALNYIIPVLGPGIDRAGDLVDKGEYAKAAGATAGIATNIAAPEAIAKGVGLAPVRSALQSTSERAYQSALKPPPASYSTKEVANMVKTGLDSGIPVSESGVAKIGSLIDDLNSKVKAQIQGGAQAGQSVNKFKVASRLSDTAKKFETQVNPESDLNAVSESGNEFIRNQPSDIPVDQAQALKSGTYRQLSSKAYGEMGSASVEAQKALARGIKEELEVQFPEIKNLNAQEGKLINLDEVLQRAVRREANKQLLPLGGPIAGATAGALTGSAPVAGVAAVMKAVLDNPEAKSRLAIALNKAGRGSTNLTAAHARIAAYSDALGNAVASANRGDQASPPQSAQ